MVVRAKNEKHARIIASENNSDEDSNAWIDSNLSTCIEIQKTGEPGLIIRNIHYA